ADTTVGGWTFNPGAFLLNDYGFTNGHVLIFNGAGIVVNAGSATIFNNFLLAFSNSSTAGSATIINEPGGLVEIRNSSTADNAALSNGGSLVFNGFSTAGSATITNNNEMRFIKVSTAGSATIINNAGGTVDFSGSTGPGSLGKISAGSIAG